MFRESVEQHLHAPAWIVDGSYECVREIVWRQTDLVIWLDYPAPLLVWRLMRRGIQYIIGKTNLWGVGNRESLRWLLGKESIIVRSLKAQRRMKAAYPQQIARWQTQHIDFVHLQSEGETNRWLLSI